MNYENVCGVRETLQECQWQCWENTTSLTDGPTTGDLAAWSLTILYCKSAYLGCCISLFILINCKQNHHEKA